MSDLLTTCGPHRHLLSSAVLADVLDGLGHRTSALPPRLRPRVEEACAQLLSLEQLPGSSFTYTFFRGRAQP